MSEALAPDAIVRRPMSYDEFETLPDGPRQEWVRGEALFMAPVTDAHGFAVGRLLVVLATALPDLAIGPEIGLKMGGSLRAPDLLVARESTSQGWVTEPPLLVVEVISPATRTEDTVRKPIEYAEAHVPRFWLVDPQLRTLDALVLVGGRWEIEAHLDEADPAGALVVDDRPVPIDLGRIIGG